MSFAIAAQAQEQVASTSNDSGQTLRQLSLEELGRIDVTSASRHAEPVGEAAAAVTVITADDIRRAGITTLPDALRLVTGMDVARVNGQTWGVSARGFLTAAGNKLVVLIDGRNVYTPLFSGTFWDQQDLILTDIDRIEVIRGPAGALWGANAVNGVINVITKSASETQGAMVHVDAGSPIGQIEARYGGSAGANADYRIYGKARYLRPLEFAANGASALDEVQSQQAGFRYDRDDTSKRNSFTLQGDAYRGNGGLADRPDIDIAGANVLARIVHTQASGGQWQAQLYYDGTYRRVPRQYAEHRDTGNVDLQYRFPAIPNNDITAGGGVDFSRSATAATENFFFDPQTRTSALWNGFVQDDLSLVPNVVDVILGAKAEHNVYTGVEFQPTARLRWRPTTTRTFWAAISRAVRMPTRFDEDLRFTAGSPAVVLRGDPAFESENVVSTEVGYRRTAARFFSYDLTAFLNNYSDLRTLEPTPPIGIPIVLRNNMEGRTAGLEATAEFAPIPDWRLHAGYSLLSERFRFVNGSRDTTQGTNEHNDPRHQFSFRSFVDLPRETEFDAVLRAVGALTNPAVPGYAELTLRFAWGRNGPVELAIVGDNLLHDRHQEFQIGGPAESIQRSVFAQVTWRLAGQ
ncbi:MAG TPA: TonB-dependent receptor plug domain-containing protein [Vicinamibacterales bacterium]|nr:TonB-dependent receptor plug domain-containing protein [Vicinamibacterales bacterium]